MLAKSIAFVLVLFVVATASAGERDDKRFASAVRAGDIPAIEKVLKKGKANINVRKFGSGRNALEFALDSDDIKLAEFLVANGARVSRSTLLHAVRENDLEAIRFLITNGANPNATDDWGRTVLGKAETKVVQELLLELGATPRCRSSSLNQVTAEGFVEVGTIKDCDLEELEYYNNEGTLVCTGPSANRGCRD